MRKRRRRTTREPSRWQASDQWRAIGSQAIRGWNAKRHLLLKCGARRKHDGEPCQQIAMKNGRCYIHGGRTPSGDHWHRPRWPDRATPNVDKKLSGKLRDLDRAARKREARVLRMTPDERKRHEEWHRARKPGKAAERERRRQERQQNAETRKRLAEPAPRISREARELRSRIAELEAAQKELQAMINQTDDLGVFG